MVALATILPVRMREVCNMVAKRPPTTRSKVTNGTRLLVGTDGRSAWARRFRDLYAAFISDAGGDDAVSEGERAILRRAATLTTELERIESVFAANGQADAGDLDLYGKTSAVLSRLLEKVGLQRRPRDITPDLSTYIAGKAAAKTPMPLPPLPTLSTPICADPK
jgi:hypothetical protein